MSKSKDTISSINNPIIGEQNFDSKPQTIKDGLKNDFCFYVFSSFKRVIKVIAILFIPFMYAFTCICAFWNPLKNIGNAPIAIASLDTPTESAPSIVDVFMNGWKNNDEVVPGKTYSDLGLTYDSKSSYYNIRVDDRVTLRKISYFNQSNGAITIANYDQYAQSNNGNGWSITTNKYYMVIAFATDFTDSFDINNHDSVNGLIDKYIGYQMNFISCEILDMGSRFAVGAVLSAIFQDFNLFDNFQNTIHTDIPNQKYAIYGVGIGELFICVGMWVGGYALVIGLDRKKRAKKLSPYKWYFQKSLVMYAFSLAQSVIVILAIGCLGFFGMGVACFYEWLLIAFGGLVFNSIIQALWFCFRDKTTGCFVLILFLILNIAGGFGTFPAIMQFKFFHYLSYILPFTWMNHAQGTILFGLFNSANYVGNILQIFKCVGILCIFAIGFYLLGLFMSRHRTREIYYGSWKSKFVLESLKELKIEHKYLDKNNRLDFKLLPQEVMIDVVNVTLKNHPYYNHFKRYRKKAHFVECDQYERSDFDN